MALDLPRAFRAPVHAPHRRLALAALCVVAGAFVALPGAAAPVVYVDGAASCAGLTPCFATVQQGVDNAGPGPAEVFVFPGTYTEQVFLLQMGSAIGESPNRLAIVGVDGAGQPAPDLVEIRQPAMTASVVDTGVTFAGFPADVTLRNLRFGSVNFQEDGQLGLNVDGRLQLDSVRFGGAVVTSRGVTSLFDVTLLENGEGLRYEVQDGVNKLVIDGFVSEGAVGTGLDLRLSGGVNDVRLNEVTFQASNGGPALVATVEGTGTRAAFTVSGASIEQSIEDESFYFQAGDGTTSDAPVMTVAVIDSEGLWTRVDLRSAAVGAVVVDGFDQTLGQDSIERPAVSLFTTDTASLLALVRDTENLTPFGNDGISAGAAGESSMALFLQDNDLGDVGGYGIDLRAFDRGSLRAMVTGNQLDDGSQGGLRARSEGLASLCLALSGNATNGTYLLEQVAGGVFQAEDTLGSNTGTVVTTGVISTVSAGTCAAGLDPLEADLELAQAVATPMLDAGEEGEITLTLTHAGGPLPAYRIEVEDLLPPGLSLVGDGARRNGGTYDAGTGIWSLPALSPLAGLEIVRMKLVVASDPDTCTGGTVLNEAEVVASGLADPDSLPGDGTGDDYAAVSVAPFCDLAIFVDGFESGTLSGWSSFTTGQP